MGERPYNPDDHLIGATCLWAARNGAGQEALKPLQASFDRILADPPRTHLVLYVGSEGMRAIPKAECLKRWCWADALFMAPATWLGLSVATGDRRYRDYALAEFCAASNFLYDPAERLYFRDSRFFDHRDEQTRKIFWSRSNGWVFAGLAQILETLPARDPDRPRLEAHFREFARRIATVQKPDGFWPSSLLTPTDTTPKSSGTALFTYGLAWGIGHGLLPRGMSPQCIAAGRRCNPQSSPTARSAGCNRRATARAPQRRKAGRFTPLAPTCWRPAPSRISNGSAEGIHTLTLALAA